MLNCLQCNEVLTGRLKRSTGVRKYCNNICQLKYQQKQMFVLVEKGEGNSRAVKTYLVEKHGNICMSPVCAWDFTKKYVKVELEHMDGNSDNNNLENCILLCPNCHSLTPTYKNKNMGKGRAFRRQRYAEGKSY